MKQPAVYMVTNRENGTVYIGVTSHLQQRIGQHRGKTYPGFAAKYGCTLLVWYEIHETMESAILREKQLKAGSRANKIALIKIMNPRWDDLYSSIL